MGFVPSGSLSHIGLIPQTIQAHQFHHQRNALCVSGGGYRRRVGILESPSKCPLHLFFCMQTSQHLTVVGDVGGGRTGSPHHCIGDEDGLTSFGCLLDQIMGESVVLMSDIVTAVAYTKKQGGIVSQVIYNLTKDILDWAEQFSVFFTVRYIMGKKNILADQRSSPDQVLSTEWLFLHWVFDDICRVILT